MTDQPPKNPMLAPNWKRILLKAHSIKFQLLNMFFGLMLAADAALPYFEDYIHVSKLWFGLLIMATAIGGIFARLWYQGLLHKGKHDE